MSDFHYLAYGRQQTRKAILPMATQQNSTTLNAPTQDPDTANRGDDQTHKERTQHPTRAALSANIAESSEAPSAREVTR